MPSVAFAGGFETPDNGAEALARGGAWTAKADSPLAQEYNVAGLARLRGTRVELGANILFNVYDFTRSGAYPGTAGDPNTPYAGMAYPKVGNQGPPFFAPLFAASSDFGYFDRWTFGLAIFGPSSVGNRSFPAALTGTPQGGLLPSPQRYDITDSNLLIFYPTLSAAVRVTRWLDIGLALHLVYGSFDLANVAIADLGGCGHGNEFPPCDARNHLSLTGFTATGALGVMARPIEQLQLGLNVRGPVYLDASGTVDSPGSKMLNPTGNSPPLTGPASSFKTTLPWVVRFGARWRFLGRDKFEHGDIELDAIYEGWGSVQGDGIHLTVDSIGPLSGFSTVLLHHYQDTFGIRLGGAFNLRLPQGVLSFRAGGYYDSNATRYKDTRLDFDTMAKWAGTVGLGYTIRGVTINLAYAFVWEPDRNVSNGDLQPLNGINGTSTSSTDGHPYPAVNNGLYHAQTQIMSFALLIHFDELLKKKRVIRYY
ncbi:MAG TPA: outer membrane protein transport protein [Polyangia bacterium]|nr:outer membrane protein transport protein [Polyangia bacterium]